MTEHFLGLSEASLPRTGHDAFCERLPGETRASLALHILLLQSLSSGQHLRKPSAADDWFSVRNTEALPSVKIWSDFKTEAPSPDRDCTATDHGVCLPAAKALGSVGPMTVVLEASEFISDPLDGATGAR